MIILLIKCGGGNARERTAHVDTNRWSFNMVIIIVNNNSFKQKHFPSIACVGVASVAMATSTTASKCSCRLSIDNVFCHE